MYQQSYKLTTEKFDSFPFGALFNLFIINEESNAKRKYYLKRNILNF